MEEALLSANQLEDVRKTAGFDQAALDGTARKNLSNGAFEDSEEDGGAIAEEFFPVVDTEEQRAITRERPSLSEQLEARATETLHSEFPE
jgi:hypothetical protein